MRENGEREREREMGINRGSLSNGIASCGSPKVNITIHGNLLRFITVDAYGSNESAVGCMGMRLK